MLRVPNNCDPNGSNKDPTTKSPSISSLCPLPIGIIASKHSGPVCKGSNTDCLSIIPTAGDSINY